MVASEMALSSLRIPYAARIAGKSSNGGAARSRWEGWSAVPAEMRRWRRDRDSNPGYLAVYTLSKRAP